MAFQHLLHRAARMTHSTTAWEEASEGHPAPPRDPPEVQVAPWKGAWSTGQSMRGQVLAKHTFYESSKKKRCFDGLGGGGLCPERAAGTQRGWRDNGQASVGEGARRGGHGHVPRSMNGVRGSRNVTSETGR